MKDMVSSARRFLIPAQSESLGIDFANTRYWRGTDAPTETFEKLDDVLAWCRDTAMIPAAMIDGFRAQGLQDAEAAFADAIALRELLYRLYLARPKARSRTAGISRRCTNTWSLPPRARN